jgi:hypothetical protein
MKHLARAPLSGQPWPYSKTLDWIIVACQGQTLYLITNIVKYRRKKFCNSGPSLKTLVNMQQIFLEKKCLFVIATLSWIVVILSVYRELNPTGLVF